jgi:predicted AlkP superfamily phosphohydrolase/phosphomutase
MGRGRLGAYHTTVRGRSDAALDAFINRGVMGNLATLQPILSPMLWNSVATGKFADKHGIHGFIEPDPINGGARPYTSISRKCKALWNILSQSSLRSNIFGWWASHPANQSMERS